jgi:hypothetical protein
MASSALVGAQMRVEVVGPQEHSSQEALEEVFEERTAVLEDALEAVAKDQAFSSGSTCDTDTLAWALSLALRSDSALQQLAGAQRPSYDMDRLDGVHHLGRTLRLLSLAQAVHHKADCDEPGHHSRVHEVGHIDRAYLPMLVRWHQEA